MSSKYFICPARRLPGFFVIVSVCLYFIGFSARAQVIDLNHNGMSDVWEWMYNAYGVDPNADSDGDGFVNWQEAIAGTDPFNSKSFPNIPSYSSSPTNFSVTLPSRLGKMYTLYSATNQANPVWVMETNAEALAGSNITLTGTFGPVMKFYRVGISDVDSDGAGLMNDWEKFALGLSPTNSSSNGQQDSSGAAMNDYEYATNLLASQNVISITVTDPTATQPDPGQKSSDTGLFTITRGGFPLDSILVNVTAGPPGPGVATMGVDYLNLPSLVLIPAGANSATLTVYPMADANLQTPVIAQVQLLPGANYSV
ncbi:MAG TPA: thrombospondin type 3 repeat-containing protein, partial [Verrucomicrobiae bacterium]|nr:thrombospondin type 3 repeat-containing protein [Verrucomicrobiae bacterium]